MKGRFENMKINRDEAVLVLVDYQERLMPAMADKEALEENVVKLAKGCGILGLPILVTQQYTRGLGETVAPIKEALENFDPIEKTTFSCYGEPAFVEALEKTGRKTVILAGIETHVCVLQTALDLVEAGYQVFLPADCVSSRKLSDKNYGEVRMGSCGVTLTSCESVLFELLKDAKHENFKAISNLVK